MLENEGRKKDKKEQQKGGGKEYIYPM